MADFSQYLHRLRQQQQQLNPIMLENFNVPDFSVDTFMEFSANYNQNNSNFMSTTSCPDILSSASVSNQNVFPETKKRKAMQQSSTCSSSKNIGTDNLARGKKWKSKDKETEDKAEEVIHFRAKRGQATDSHSMAERVRREKINNKFKCLEDLVPGCHKSMGMAVKLEEIINYVHSLQNQVEFLSMELTAASCCYDQNLETESSNKVQGTSSSDEQQNMQQWWRPGFGDLTCFHSTPSSI